MCTYVLHLNTAPIHQGSCIALGDFLVKEEPHYAVEEVLSKNTCRALLLSAHPRTAGRGSVGLLQLLRAHGYTSPPCRPGSLVFPVGIRISHDLGEFPGMPWHLPEPERLLTMVSHQDSYRGGRSHWWGLIPQRPTQLWAGLEHGVVRDGFSL